MLLVEAYDEEVVGQGGVLFKVSIEFLLRLSHSARGVISCELILAFTIVVHIELCFFYYLNPWLKCNKSNSERGSLVRKIRI